MGVQLGELSVILDANARKFEKAFDSAGKNLKGFGGRMEKLEKQAAAVTSSLSKFGTMVSQSGGAHAQVAIRNADALSGKMSVLGKSTYATNASALKLGMSTRALAGPLALVASLAAAAGAAFIGMATAAGVALFNGLKYAADESAKETAILAGLEQALARTGDNGARRSAELFNEFASDLQRVTRFSDDMIVKAAALGVALGIPHGRLEEFSLLAMDVSTRTGKSLEEVMSLLGKAANGQGRAIQTLIGSYDKARFAAEGLDYVVEVLSGRFGGAAVNAAQNYEGRLIGMWHAYGDVIERLGAYIEKNEFVNAAIEEVTATFAALGDWLNNNGDTVRQWVNGGMAALKILVGTVAFGVDKSIAAFSIFSGAVSTFIGVMLTPVRVATEALGTLLGAISRIVAKLASTTIGKKLGLTPQLAVEIATIGGEVEGMGEALQDTFFDVGREYFEMAKKMATGEAGFQAEWDKFTQRIMERAAAIRNLPPPPVGDPIEPPGAAGGKGKGGEVADMEERRHRVRMLAQAKADAARAAANAQASSNLELIGKFAGPQGSALTGAAQAGFTGGFGAMAAGPHAALAQVGLQLLTQSKQFQAIMEMVNPLLQAFADVIGSALAPLQVIIEPLARELTYLFQVITPLLELVNMLNPAFITLEISARVLGQVINWVAKGILNAIIAFLRGIQKLAKKLHIKVGALDDAIDSLKDLRDGLDDLGDAASAATEALINVPEGFKAAMYRWGAQSPESGRVGGGTGGSLEDDIGLVPEGGSSGGPPFEAPGGYHWENIGGAWILVQNSEQNGDGSTGQSASSASSGSSASSAGANVIYIEQLVALDPEQAFDELDRVAKRRNYVRSGSTRPVSPSAFGRKV